MICLAPDLLGAKKFARAGNKITRFLDLPHESNYNNKVLEKLREVLPDHETHLSAEEKAKKQRTRLQKADVDRKRKKSFGQEKKEGEKSAFGLSFGHSRKAPAGS